MRAFRQAAEQGDETVEVQRLGQRTGDTQAEGGGEPGGGFAHPFIEAGHEDQHRVRAAGVERAQQFDTVIIPQAEVEHDDVEGMLGQ